MAAFEHVDEDEARKIRSAEMEDVNALITEQQSDLVKAASNPSYLDECIERDMPTPKGESNLPIAYEAMGTDVVQAIKTQRVAALMSPQLTSNGIQQIKSSLEGHKNTAVRRAEWLTNKTSKISQAIEKLPPFFKEQAAVALAATKDTLDHIENHEGYRLPRPVRFRERFYQDD